MHARFGVLWVGLGKEGVAAVESARKQLQEAIIEPPPLVRVVNYTDRNGVYEFLGRLKEATRRWIVVAGTQSDEVAIVNRIDEWYFFALNELTFVDVALKELLHLLCEPDYQRLGHRCAVVMAPPDEAPKEFVVDMLSFLQRAMEKEKPPFDACFYVGGTNAEGWQFPTKESFYELVGSFAAFVAKEPQAQAVQDALQSPTFHGVRGLEITDFRRCSFGIVQLFYRGEEMQKRVAEALSSKVMEILFQRETSSPDEKEAFDVSVESMCQKLLTVLRRIGASADALEGESSELRSFLASELDSCFAKGGLCLKTFLRKVAVWKKAAQKARRRLLEGIALLGKHREEARYRVWKMDKLPSFKKWLITHRFNFVALLIFFLMVIDWKLFWWGLSLPSFWGRGVAMLSVLTAVGLVFLLLQHGYPFIKNVGWGEKESLLHRIERLGNEERILKKAEGACLYFCERLEYLDVAFSSLLPRFGPEWSEGCVQSEARDGRFADESTKEASKLSFPLLNELPLIVIFEQDAPKAQEVWSEFFGEGGIVQRKLREGGFQDTVLKELFQFCLASLEPLSSLSVEEVLSRCLKQDKSFLDDALSPLISATKPWLPSKEAEWAEQYLLIGNGDGKSEMIASWLGHFSPTARFQATGNPTRIWGLRVTRGLKEATLKHAFLEDPQKERGGFTNV